MKNIKHLALIALLTTSTITPALSQNKTEGFYGGLGYLKSDHNIIKYSELTYPAEDDKDNGFTAFLGYDLNKRLAIEVGYNDLGESTRTAIVNGDNLNGRNKVKVLTAAGVLKSDPIANNLVFFIKGGLARIDHDEDISGGATENNSVKSTNLFYGLGANYEFSKGLAIRAAYEVYGKDDGLSNVNDTDTKPDRADPKALTISFVKKF
jgi:opacity protein-like surface antigen